MAELPKIAHFRLMPVKKHPNSRNVALRTTVYGSDLVIARGLTVPAALTVAQIANFAYRLGRLHGEGVSQK